MKRKLSFLIFSLFFTNFLNAQSILVSSSEFDDANDVKSKWTPVYPYNHEKISEKNNQTVDLKWEFFNLPENVNTIIGRFAFEDSALVENGILKLRNRASLEGDTFVLDTYGEMHSNFGYSSNNPEPRKIFTFDPTEWGMFEAKVKLEKSPGLQFEISAIPSRFHNKNVQEGNNWITTSPHTVQNNVNENGWCALNLTFFDFTFGLENAIIPSGTMLWGQFDEKNVECNYKVPASHLQDEYFGSAYEWYKQLYIDDETWYDQWHILSATWDDEGFTTYIDGQQWAKVTYNENGAGLPKGQYQFKMVYRVYTDNNSEPKFGELKIDNEWKEVQIDYIRFYKEEK